MDASRPLRLEGVVQPYAWGSPTAIPALLGREPTGEPQAELWLGAHPMAPARLGDGASEGVALDAWIRSHPEAALGAAVAARFGEELPFLLKVLAAAQPLSIQAHPNAEQAREGFARENEEGLPLDAPDRCYRDPRPKPELICAFTSFSALNRFREPEAILALLSGLDAGPLGSGLAVLRASPDASGLARFLEVLLALRDPDRDEGRRLVDAAVALASRRGAEAESAWVRRLATLHPEDPMVLAPWILNLVALEPGQAMFLGAGELHAYLEGVGIECMGSSDNVLRGGLTPKHVDGAELGRVLSWESGDVEILSPRSTGAAELCYETPAPEFSLSRIECSAGAVFESRATRGPEILLCTRGEGCIACGESEQALRSGASLFVPAGAPAYRVSGDVQLFRAGVGRLGSDA